LHIPNHFNNPTIYIQEEGKDYLFDWEPAYEIQGKGIEKMVFID